MALEHIAFATSTNLGAALATSLRQFENALDRLRELHATFSLMIDGDGSSATHFTYLTDTLSTSDNTKAKALFDELSSALAKLTTDASVSNVNAATQQLFNKLRQG